MTPCIHLSLQSQGQQFTLCPHLSNESKKIDDFSVWSVFYLLVKQVQVDSEPRSPNSYLLLLLSKFLFKFQLVNIQCNISFRYRRKDSLFQLVYLGIFVKSQYKCGFTFELLICFIGLYFFLIPYT